MTMPRLVALYSPVMQSGKSTIAGHLVKEHGFTLVKFADPLKRMVEALLRDIGMDDLEIERRLEGSLKEQPIPALHTHTGCNGPSSRHLLQSLGTEWGRGIIGDDLWVKVASQKVADLLPTSRVVIDDLRFPNELDMVVRLWGVPVKVIRPSQSAYKEHRSEGQLDTIPMYTLRNEGTLDDLIAKADSLAEGKLFQ